MHFSGKDQSVKIALGSANAFDDCFIRDASPWISRQTNKIIILNSNQDIVEQVYAHICKNHDSPLKINELANQFGVSHSSLFTRFKERCGKPPKQFILIVKIDKAKQMLDESADSVSEIAQEIGFGGYFTFEKAFKKTTGFSPTEWRKRNHWSLLLSLCNPSTSANPIKQKTMLKLSKRNGSSGTERVVGPMTIA